MVVLGSVAFLTFVVLTIYIALHNGTFNPIEFGTATAAMLAGIGGGYLAKSKAEPTQTE